MRPVLLALFVTSLAACWEETPRPSAPAEPEECKVTTNPEACRKQFERR
jgi:hypothetical protein